MTNPPHSHPDPQTTAADVAPTIPGLDIVGPIATGGHSVVYLGHQAEHHRPVAVKVLNAALDGTARRRFDRERATLGRVSTHPAVIGLFDSGVATDGRAYLVLEWAPNGSLAEHLAIEGTMTSSEVTALGICLAGALEHAHRSGVMHRDIKPSNIVRSEYGDWLLTDFSVAAFDDPRVATDAIQVSFAHCAPESFSRPAPSPQADVYSLASVLATAHTGAEPNALRPDETVTQAIARIASTPLPPVPPAVTGRLLAEVLDRALSLDPEHRPRSMRAFANALAAVRRDAGDADVTFRIGSDVTVVLEDEIDEPPSPADQREDGTASEPPRRRLARSTGVSYVAAGALAAASLGGGYLAADASAATDLLAQELAATAALAALAVAEPVETPSTTTPPATAPSTTPSATATAEVLDETATTGDSFDRAADDDQGSERDGRTRTGDPGRRPTRGDDDG